MQFKEFDFDGKNNVVFVVQLHNCLKLIGDVTGVENIGEINLTDKPEVEKGLKEFIMSGDASLISGDDELSTTFQAGHIHFFHKDKHKSLLMNNKLPDLPLEHYKVNIMRSKNGPSGVVKANKLLGLEGSLADILKEKNIGYDISIIKVKTHSRKYHADEMVAIALLCHILPNEMIIERINYEDVQDEIAKDKLAGVYDKTFYVDIGRVNDMLNRKFDHHQYQFGKSSAGLMLDYFLKDKKSEDYPKLCEFIKRIDENDTGVKKSTCSEFPEILNSMNKGFCGEFKFDEALNFTKMVIGGLIRRDEDRIIAKKQIDDSITWLDENIAEFNTDLPKGAESVLNGTVMPKLHYYTYPKYDENDEEIRVIKTANTTEDSYDKVGQPLPQDTELADFVHSNGFLAMFRNTGRDKTARALCEYYIKKHLLKK